MVGILCCYVWYQRVELINVPLRIFIPCRFLVKPTEGAFHGLGWSIGWGDGVNYIDMENPGGCPMIYQWWIFRIYVWLLGAQIALPCYVFFLLQNCKSALSIVRSLILLDTSHNHHPIKLQSFQLILYILWRWRLLSLFNFLAYIPMLFN